MPSPRAALSRLGYVRKQFRALQARSDLLGRSEALFFFSALDAPADAQLHREAAARRLAVSRVRGKPVSAVFRRGAAGGLCCGAAPTPFASLFAGPILIVAPRDNAPVLFERDQLDFLTRRTGLVLLAGKIGGELMYPVAASCAVRARDVGGSAHVVAVLRAVHAQTLDLLRTTLRVRTGETTTQN